MKKFSILFLAAIALLLTGCIEDPLRAAFSYESTGVYTITFNNVSLGAKHYTWDFGDGETATEKNPTHVYPAAGTYRVILTAKDSKGNSDDVIKDVVVRRPGVYMCGFKYYKIPYESRYYSVYCYDDDWFTTTWKYGGVYTPLLTASNIPYTQKLAPRLMSELEGDNYYNVWVHYSKTTSESGTECLKKKLQKTEILKYKDEYIFTEGGMEIGVLMEYR